MAFGSTRQRTAPSRPLKAAMAASRPPASTSGTPSSFRSAKRGVEKTSPVLGTRQRIWFVAPDTAVT